MIARDRPRPSAKLAPAPDFRYVGLEVVRSRRLGAWVSLLGTGAFLGTTVREGPGVGALIGVGVAATATLVARAFGWNKSVERGEGRTGMAIVPWGVLIDFDDRSRILRWPAIARVVVDSVHGRDQGTSLTRYSVVTVETPRERFVGRAPGSLPLERLAAHLEDYARESSHRIALDLDGARSGEGPSEPDVELVLAAVRAYVETSGAASRLGLTSGGGYRQAGGRGPSARGVVELSAVLRDRTPRDADPRPFAAVLAAELFATGVAEDLVALVQSPLPLLAAVSKVAAAKLGVAKSKVGTLEEVEPFLLRRDAEALAAWQGA